MAEEKKGLFARMFGPKKSGCCGYSIEEIPEEGAWSKALQPARPQSTGSSCCGSAAMVSIIDIGGSQVGIVGLREAIAEVKGLGLSGEDQIKRELLDRIKRQNYVAQGDEEAYGEALWREYLMK